MIANTDVTSFSSSSELALDESESLLPVLLAIALVHLGIIAITAVGVCCIAIRLDQTRERWAGEPRWSWIELGQFSCVREDRISPYKLTPLEEHVPTWNDFSAGEFLGLPAQITALIALAAADEIKDSLSVMP